MRRNRRGRSEPAVLAQEGWRATIAGMPGSRTTPVDVVNRVRLIAASTLLAPLGAEDAERELQRAGRLLKLPEWKLVAEAFSVRFKSARKDAIIRAVAEWVVSRDNSLFR